MMSVNTIDVRKFDQISIDSHFYDTIDCNLLVQFYSKDDAIYLCRVLFNTRNIPAYESKTFFLTI